MLNSVKADDHVRSRGFLVTALDTMAVGPLERHQPLSEPRWDIVLHVPTAGDSEVPLSLPIDRSFGTFGCRSRCAGLPKDPASEMGPAHQSRAQMCRGFDARCVCLPCQCASKWAGNDRFTNARAASRLSPTERFTCLFLKT